MINSSVERFMDKVNELFVTDNSPFKLYTTEPVVMQSVWFVSMDGLLDFCCRTGITTLFRWNKFGSKKDYYVSDSIQESFDSEDLTQDKKDRIREYNDKVSKVNFSIPIEQAIYVIHNGVIYGYREATNEIFNSFKLENSWEKVQNIMDGLDNIE